MLEKKLFGIFLCFLWCSENAYAQVSYEFSTVSLADHVGTFTFEAASQRCVSANGRLLYLRSQRLLDLLDEVHARFTSKLIFLRCLLYILYMIYYQIVFVLEAKKKTTIFSFFKLVCLKKNSINSKLVCLKKGVKAKYLNSM